VVIDTLSLYEKLKENMDPAAAEKLAQALATSLVQIEQSVRQATEGRLSRVEQALETLVRVTQEHSLEIAELRQASRENTLAIAELSKAVQENTSAIAELRQTVSGLVEVTQRHSQEIAELRQMVQENTSAIAELRQTVSGLVEVTQRHSQEIAELRQMVQENTSAIAELRQTVSGLVEVTQRHSREIAELRQMVQENTSAIAELRQAVRELVETTKKHAQVLRRLELDQQDIRKQLGGLAMAFGYRLEDDAYLALPRLLKQDYGIEVQGRLKRDYLVDRQGNHLEVNILGEGVREGETITIVGESKAQLSANEIDRFLRRKVRRLQGVYPNLFPIIVTYMTTSPDVLEHARQRGVAVYFLYDFRQQ
jgi:myosin heavy subunit